jgi:hypothetical protein
MVGNLGTTTLKILKPMTSATGTLRRRRGYKCDRPGHISIRNITANSSSQELSCFGVECI